MLPDSSLEESQPYTKSKHKAFYEFFCKLANFKKRISSL